MNFVLVGATFAIVVPAELPDKTFISAIILSSRYRALPVWIGAASGLVLQAAIAVLAGRLLAFLPHRVVEIIIAVLFLLGAAYLIFVPEKREIAEGEHIAEQEQNKLAPPISNLRIAMTTFGIVALAEFGDLTQVVIANLSARFRDPWSIFVGAAAAFIVVSALGVVTGRTLTRFIPLQIVRRLSGLALLGLGIWSIVGAAT